MHSLTWCHVFVCPLEEATLLLPGFGAGVELPPLIGPILLDGACDGWLVALANRATSRIGAVASKKPWASPSSWALEFCRAPSYKGLGQRGAQWSRLASVLRVLISPEKKVAGAGAAFVKLPALVGPFLAHGQEQGFIPAVAHHGIVPIVWSG